MRFNISLLSMPMLLTTLALAQTPTCLPAPIATGIVTSFVSLLTNYSTSTAVNLLSPNYTDTSDSINYIGGFPLGYATFPNATAFEYGQGEQPAIGMKVLAIDAITCAGVIVFRWNATVGEDLYEVKGINVLYAGLTGTNASTIGPSGWQLDTVFSEFNSAAWIEDIGGNCISPAAVNSTTNANRLRLKSKVKA